MQSKVISSLDSENAPTRGFGKSKKRNKYEAFRKYYISTFSPSGK